MFETGITEPGKVGPGIIGIGGRVDYWSWAYSTDYSWTWIAISAFANYHFILTDNKWDLFAGLGLVYENISWSNKSALGGVNLYPSTVTLQGNAGARYFFSPNLAGRALVGFGISYITVGVDFGLN
ncbi:MAG: hypothetical protein WCH46_11025 [bacterium]